MTARSSLSLSNYLVPMALVACAFFLPVGSALGAEVVPADPVHGVIDDVVTTVFGLAAVLMSWVVACTGQYLQRHLSAQEAVAAQQVVNTAADTILHAAQANVQHMVDAGVAHSALHNTVLYTASEALRGVVGPLLGRLGIGPLETRTLLIGRLRAMDPSLAWTPPPWKEMTASVASLSPAQNPLVVSRQLPDAPLAVSGQSAPDAPLATS